MPVKISVVTPSFNQAKFLEETLRSVISQREHVHEYFVLDGGSMDGSAEIIQKYREGIDYWVSQKDKGQSDAIHRGFSRASGDYICWLNSDDLFLPGSLKKIHDALERNPSWDAISGYHVAIDGRSRIIQANRIPGESASLARWGVQHVCQPTCVFRRSLYERLGGLNLSLHCVMDTDLWFRMFDVGATWGHLREYLAAFRKHEQAKGITDRWAQRYAEEVAALSDRFPQFAADTPRHLLGRLVYRAGQILSGRYPLSRLHTAAWKGKTVAEVFGCDVLSDATPTNAPVANPAQNHRRSCLSSDIAVGTRGELTAPGDKEIGR